MRARVFLRQNDNLIEIEELASIPPIDLSGATVTAEMVDKDGNAIGGTSITLGYVAGTTYDFRGTFPATVSVQAGDRGTMTLDVVGTGIPVAHWDVDYVVEDRRA